MQDDNGQPSFAGKLFRLQPRPTRDCPKDIGYHEVVAYGELVYRSRLNLKTTLADLAAVDRMRTVAHPAQGRQATPGARSRRRAAAGAA